MDPLGEFLVIDDQSQAQWANPAAKDEDKYKDIIATARAGWINDVSGVKPSDDFNVAASKKDVKPGLNYLKTSGSEAGETGYIDAKGVYHNPDLPIDADTDPLPRIAVILTNNAFSRDKDWALETLRHELGTYSRTVDHRLAAEVARKGRRKIVQGLDTRTKEGEENLEARFCPRHDRP